LLPNIQIEPTRLTKGLTLSERRAAHLARSADNPDEARSMIKAVFFDLDGTLSDRDSLVRESAVAQFDAFSGQLLGVSREQFVSHCHLSPDTASTLDTLRTHGKRLGVITNDGTTRQRALQRCGVDAGEAVFVGDHPETDIVGAEQALASVRDWSDDEPRGLCAVGWAPTRCNAILPLGHPDKLRGTTPCPHI
jgi:FMN phosphatase YigB (HAD superfamily)